MDVFIDEAKQDHRAGDFEQRIDAIEASIRDLTAGN
jgi:hypothetical protein